MKIDKEIKILEQTGCPETMDRMIKVLVDMILDAKTTGDYIMII